MVKKTKNEKQLEDISTKLDKIIGLLTIQNTEDKNDKVYLLKKQGWSSRNIGFLLGIQNVRQMEGWKRK